MQLEWFRTHKKFVYWVLLPLVGGTMAFYFGPMTRGSGSFFGQSGPRLKYTLNKDNHYLSSSEVINYRHLFSQYWGQHVSVDSVQAGHLLFGCLQAKSAGFEVGFEEMKDGLRTEVENQLKRRQPDLTKVEATEQAYNALLSEMKLNPPEFEQLAHDFAVAAKFNQFQQNLNINDNELFAKYCEEKQSVRIRYKKIKSIDYMGKTTPADDTRVKDFYEKNKDSKTDMKGVLFSDEKMSGELLAIDGEKYLASLKPTEEGLKQTYEQFKMIKWPIEPEKRTKDNLYKPYEEVKAEVEKEWREQRKFQISSELDKLQKELEQLRKDYAEVYPLWHHGEPESERTPFDTAAWARSKGDYVVYWTTDELTEQQFAKGKKELRAKDAGWLENIFRWAHVQPGMERYKETYDKYFNGFTPPTAIDPAKPEKGYVLAHKLQFKEMGLKPLDEAKPAILEVIKVQDAAELAKKEADQARQDWDEGKNLPKIDDLDEFIATSETRSNNPLAGQFFGGGAPKPIGEMLPVESEQAKPSAPERANFEPHKDYYVGFAVEYKLPKYADFEKDTVWDRQQHRDQLDRMYSYSLSRLIEMNIRNAIVKVPQDMQDPPLYDAYGRGD